MTVANMSHLTLHVRDLEASVRFYESLGYTATNAPFPITPLERVDLGSRAEFGGFEPRMAILSLGLDPRTETCVELLEVRGLLPKAKPAKTVNEVGIHRHCFRVRNIDTSIAVLKDRGIEPSSAVLSYDMPEHTTRYAFVFDPDDNLIELVEFTGRIKMPQASDTQR